MRELMAHSVSVWESDPEAYSYHPVGYMQISPEVMHAGVATIYEQQKAIGYASTFIEGADDCATYMQGLFPTGRRRGSPPSCTRSVAATPTTWPRCMASPAKATREGVRIAEGVTVTGFEFGHNSRAVARGR